MIGMYENLICHINILKHLTLELRIASNEVRLENENYRQLKIQQINYFLFIAN